MLAYTDTGKDHLSSGAASVSNPIKKCCILCQV